MSNRKTALKHVVEALEGLAEEKAALDERIKEVKTSAKARGLSVKVIGSILKLRRMSEEARAEYEGLLDLYKADLGMLDGTPLGKYARDRMAKDEKKGEGEEEAKTPSPAPPSAEEIEAARREGAAAFEAGKEVLANPYGAADPRRAAWDEGFCAAAGSDGMDIPEAWKPDAQKKGKPEKNDDDPEGGEK